MKKLIIYTLLLFSIVSCKKTDVGNTSNESREIQNDTKATTKNIIDDLTTGEFADSFATYSKEALVEIAKELRYEMVPPDGTSNEPQEYIKDVSNVENNIISLNWQVCGTGGCVKHQTLHVKGDDVIDLGNGYDKLSEAELNKLEKEVKKIVPHFSHISGRFNSELQVTSSGNYKVTSSGLIEEDSEASGGSLEIVYETVDLKTYIPSTLNVRKR